MKVLKIVGIVVLLLALVLFGGGMLLSPKFHIERSTVISAPPDKAYALVADPHRWKEWTVWNRRDPAMKIEYFGAASGAGSGWAWKSASEGDGRMTLTAVEPNQRVAFDLYFPDFDSTSTGALSFTPEGAGTKVVWAMDGDMGKNPIGHWMGLFMDGMVGKDFDAGLANLKALAEKP
jgi:uncharacterized protein YndB with AHSA1/START domain